jgi:threonine/homoserine/homoserine lactone efflux protein
MTVKSTLAFGLAMLIYSYSAAHAGRLFASRRATRNLNRGAGTVLVGTDVIIATR